MKRTFLLAATALATVAPTTTSVAQSAADDATRTAPPALTGVAWHAYSVTVDGVTREVPEGSRAGLRFGVDQPIVTGHDGCNGFKGEAVVDTDRSVITFGSEFASTMIACYPSDHVNVIPSPAGTYETRVTAHTLTLTGPDGRVITLTR